MWASSLSNVDLPEPFRPTRPKASPESTSRSTSRRAQISRVCGSSRRRIASFRERLCESRIRNLRPSPRPRICPGATSVMSELDRDAVLVPLHNREAEQRHERPYEEDVDEDRDARHRRLEDDGADALDIRGNRVAVAEQMDDRLMRCGRGKLVEPVEHRREEEPGQEHDGDQVLDVPEEDVRDREHPGQAQSEAEKRKKEGERERHRPRGLRYDIEGERNED